jgi:hypothetical protein
VEPGWLRAHSIKVALAALYLVFEFAGRHGPFPYAAGIVAVLGFSPYSWEVKGSIFVFSKPRLLALVAARNVSTYQNPKTMRTCGTISTISPPATFW